MQQLALYRLDEVHNDVVMIDANLTVVDERRVLAAPIFSKVKFAGQSGGMRTGRYLKQKAASTTEVDSSSLYQSI